MFNIIILNLFIFFIGFSSISFAAASLGISAGLYVDTFNNSYPLLIVTNDDGSTWSYPSPIFKNLKEKIDPHFLSGILSGASCSGSLNQSVCISPGLFCAGSICSNENPLLAVGSQNGSTWTYPKSIFKNLQKVIDPDFMSGYLASGSCTELGSGNMCIAVGSYFSTTTNFPLLALSINNGQDWTYPPAIYQNLQTAIDPSFQSGSFTSASCTSNICIAAGAFCSGMDCPVQLPLVALSQNNGKSWSYPAAVFKNLDSKIDPNFGSGSFVSSSCTGAGKTAICIAVGNFYNGTTLPMLVQSLDGGRTWTYPTSIFTNLPRKIGDDFQGGNFNSVSCTGYGETGRCIATGSFFTSTIANIPFLAISKQGGHAWYYPPFIYKMLKILVDPNFVSGIFNSATCSGNTCMAAGQYCTDSACANMFPLLVLTSNGGVTWSYPTEIFTNLKSVIDPDFVSGFFSDVSCTNLCIASGEYSTSTGTFPLLAFSTDNGITWTYPPYVFQDLPVKIDPNFVYGVFNKAGTSTL